MATAQVTGHSRTIGSDEIATLVVEQGRFVWRVLRHQGVPERQIEDLCQEVFVVVVRKFATFEQRSAVRTWIYGICRNVAADARRRTRRKPEVLTDTPPDTAAPEKQTELLAQRDARGHLRMALDRLAETTRMVFVLYEIENMPMSEVAKSVGCNLSTAYSRLYAARKQVRSALEAFGLSEDDFEFAEVG
jgi:RNA polymerase sigma-70 factor (ECF subfamily)